MSAPIRVQLSRAKGWRMPPDTVKVDRSTRWGNPYVVGPSCAAYTGKDAAARFRAEIETLGGFWPRASSRFAGSPFIAIEVIQRELGGKNLACWCKPGDGCHADVLLEIANGVAAAPPIGLPDAAREALALLDSYGPDDEQDDDDFVRVRANLRQALWADHG